MRTGCRDRVRRSMSAVRSWPVWRLSRGLLLYISAVIGAYLIAVAVSTRTASLDLHGFMLLGALLACSAATVELTKREGENAGLIVDVYGIWGLPVAILLPPLYGLAIPAFRWALIQWRVRRVSFHRRAFTAAATGLSYGSASLAFHAFTGTSVQTLVNPLASPTLWVLAVAGAGVARWFVNTSLMLPAIKSSDPAASMRKLLFSRETLHNDLTELCVAVLVTAGIAISLLTILFAFPFVTLLQRSFRHGQLVNASRMDSKTGLLNAGTWEREAASEVARAIRTRSPLAVALIDIDHFKAVNDVHGHLVGDRALKAISRTLSVFLREYDLIGRFGGEEFALLLPQTRAVDAYRIAERIRAYIAAMPIDTGSDINDEPVTITVSIGVAALGVRWDTSSATQLTDLIAAADAALYRAKRDGRDQVCVVTEKATFVGQSAPANQKPETPVSQPGEVPPPDEASVSSPEPAGSQA